MKPPANKLQQVERQQVAAEVQNTTQNAAEIEFTSVEEMLRFDAAQVSPPPSVAERLNQSLAAEPKPKTSWWRRWFGSSGS